MKSMLRMTAAVVASVLVHMLVLNAAQLLPALPDTGFSLETPVEVELGFVDPSPVPKATLPSATAAPPDEAKSAAQEAVQSAEPLPTSPTEPKPATADAAIPDKPVTDAGVDAAEAPDGAIADAGVSDGGADGEPVAAPLVASTRGAQVSLRVDLDGLRRSPYADLIAPLVSQSPDVRAILDGSEIDPMRDLDRLWVASPDLTREHAVIAGQYHGGTHVAVAAAKRLAGSKKPRLRFRARGPFQVAPWQNPDPTPRVLGLLGGETFVIARETDLGAVLAIAQHLTENTKSGEPGADRLGRSLLNLGSGVLLQLDVESVGNFIRDRSGNPPLRLTAQATTATGKPGVVVRAVGTFASPDDARLARDRLRELQKRYGAHPLVMLLGFSAVIRNADLKLQDATLRLRAELSDVEVRNLLAMLAPPTPRPATPPAIPVPPAARPAP